jgi:hypothetical protein
MPGRMTPDFNGNNGRVTVWLAMLLPSQVIEFT